VDVLEVFRILFTNCLSKIVHVRSDHGKVRPEKVRSLMFSFKYYWEKNDNCLYSLVKIVEIQ